jgi:hypothetical protein
MEPMPWPRLVFWPFEDGRILPSYTFGPRIPLVQTQIQPTDNDDYSMNNLRPNLAEQFQLLSDFGHADKIQRLRTYNTAKSRALLLLVDPTINTAIAAVPLTTPAQPRRPLLLSYRPRSQHTPLTNMTTATVLSITAIPPFQQSSSAFFRSLLQSTFLQQSSAFQSLLLRPIQQSSALHSLLSRPFQQSNALHSSLLPSGPFQQSSALQSLLTWPFQQSSAFQLLL